VLIDGVHVDGRTTVKRSLKRSRGAISGI